MSVYQNTNPNAPVVSVEFAPLPEGNFTFFRIRDAEKVEDLKKWLTSSEVGQEIIAQTQTQSDGTQILVTHGHKRSEDISALLARTGENFEIPKEKTKFDPWKWRGRFSNIGQTFNLISGFQNEGKLTGPKIMFAALNFAASGVNATFGGQKSEDEYQLRHLKSNINHLLAGRLPPGTDLPNVDEDRVAMRADDEAPKTLGQKCNELMRKNSVRIGEIGLRYLGSVALAFPMTKWKPAAKLIGEGSLKEAFHIAKNPDSTNFWTGVTYLTGKTIGLFSKVPDPYNPVPSTGMDKIREKYLFQASSLIETGAAGVLAVGNAKVKNPSKHQISRAAARGLPAPAPARDLIGAAGGATLMAGLTTRLFAKFGTREVDMDELYAHTTDVLAQASPEQLPQMLADCAASIKDHFKEKAPEYGAIYLKLMTDLYRYHRIALEKPAEQKAQEHQEMLAQAEPQKENSHAEAHPKRGGYAEHLAASETKTPEGHVRA